MVKAISFSLFGDDPCYVKGLIENVRIKPDFYPDWKVFCYVDVNTFERNKEELLELDVSYFEMDGSSYPVGGALWRFFGITESDACIFRDADSLFSHKEVVATEEWLASDKDFHIMRDHIYHGEKMMAGMWGYKGAELNNIKTLAENYPDHGYDYGCDQHFLRDVIYPMTIDNAVVHDDRFKYEEYAKTFPDFIYDHNNPHVGHQYFGKRR